MTTLYRLDTTDNGLLVGTLERNLTFHTECAEQTSGRGKRFHQAEVRFLEEAIKVLTDNTLHHSKDF